MVHRDSNLCWAGCHTNMLGCLCWAVHSHARTRPCPYMGHAPVLGLHTCMPALGCTSYGPACAYKSHLAVGLCMLHLRAPCIWVSLHLDFSPTVVEFKASNPNNLYLDLIFSLHLTLKAFRSSRTHALGQTSATHRWTNMRVEPGHSIPSSLYTLT